MALDFDACVADHKDVTGLHPEVATWRQIIRRALEASDGVQRFSACLPRTCSRRAFDEADLIGRLELQHLKNAFRPRAPRAWDLSLLDQHLGWCKRPIKYEYAFPDGTDLELRLYIELEKEDESYRRGILKLARRCIRRFWSLFINYAPMKYEVEYVENVISNRAERLLKTLLQVLTLQLCIGFLLNTLLSLLDSECLQPSILSYHWVKRHGARPPRGSWQLNNCGPRVAITHTGVFTLS